MNDRITKTVRELQRVMQEEAINPINGLPYELFLFSTTLLPFVNVDLLTTNDKGQVLLSWRDDKYYGRGWQIPGGIIRMRETIDDRIQKTALTEIGVNVSYDIEPIAVRQCIISKKRIEVENQLERSHNIVLLYKCKVPSSYKINNNKEKVEEGYLRWFDRFPENLLECHRLAYGDILEEWFD